MRLLLKCRTHNSDRQQLEALLEDTGWVPNHPEPSTFLKAQREDVLQKLPQPVRAELEDTNPILITTHPGVWGLVSFELKNALIIRLIGDTPDPLKQQCLNIITRFPKVYRSRFQADCEFDSDVEIRRFDGNTLIARGRINYTEQVGLARYIWRMRRRERIVLLSLASLSVASVGAAAYLFVKFASPGWEYFRGYLDRGATTFVTAALTLVINLVFEYRDWRTTKAMIEWSDA